ncbi:MAG: virulence RhuM family protein [Kiritimatiellae bacterium]|nr:virulence RhuM family protein [Kiritimatiellia bacterium]
MSASENQIVVYQPNETVRLDVRLENETVWLNRHQMAQLFDRDVKTIGKHIANALSEELTSSPVVSDFATTQKPQYPTVAKSEIVGTSQNAVVAKFATTAADGKVYQVEYYSLDVILSVGYRVKSAQGIMFRRWANTVLREYLLRGYSVNARLNQLEDKVDRRLALHEKEIVDLKDKVDFFVQTKEPPLQGVFYDGQLWDARALVLKLIAGAKKSLMLIDNWANAEVLDLFAKKRKGVKVAIFTSEHCKKGVPHHQISDADIAAFDRQYGKLSVRYSETFHDRFLVIDDKELYLIGASLKDLGRKCFAFTKLDSGEIPRIKKSAFGGSAVL